MHYWPFIANIAAQRKTDAMHLHAERLSEILGSAAVRSGAALQGFDRGFDPGNLGAELAVLPANAGQVAEVVRYCAAHTLSLVPQGGRTGLSGAASSSRGQIILMTHAMAEIITIDPVSQTALVEAGCTLQALEEAVRLYGLTCGVDLGARGTATIGGMIATNAGGQEAFRFGPMRQRVLGLEVVLPDGRILSDLTRVIKANGGYDIKQLFIGSEGTLGVVTRACLRLASCELLPGTTALVALKDIASGIRLFRRLEAPAPGRLLRAELMSANHANLTALDHGATDLAKSSEQSDCAIFEFTDPDILEGELELALEEGLISDALVCKNQRERAAVWKIREDWAVDRAFPDGLWFDMSVPLANLETCLNGLRSRLSAYDPALQLFYIGHLGDGNVHVTINATSPISRRYKEVSKLVYADLTELGGFFSAEHGIGLEKREALADQSDPVKLALMHDIKRLLDPLGIMNPGKVLQP